MKFNILNIHHLQPYKYLHLLRLLEAGFSTRAQDYTRVLAEHVAQCVAGGHVVEQETVPNWVNNTLFLAEKLKYLVRVTMMPKEIPRSLNNNTDQSTVKY